MNKKVLVVEDDVSFGQMLSKWFERNNFEVKLCNNVENAKIAFTNSKYHLILTDLRLPDGDGIELLIWLNERKSRIPVIIMTGYGEVQTAVSAIKLGAFDFLEKPINPSVLEQKIESAFREKDTGESQSHKKKPTAEVKHSVRALAEDQKIVEGRSVLSKQMYDYIKTVAPTTMSVMIIGESGTGKEHVARMIHELSSRKDQPFIAVDCGALSMELAPSELFGHKKGSFTSAIDDKTGFFVEANGGTLFLDEIGNLPYGVQRQLLRSLQEKQVRPIGTSKNIDVDVRIIAATNEDLEKAFAEGNFREDLYHRLNEFEIEVPPLRARRKDIRLFAEHFIAEANAELEKDIQHITDDAMAALENYSWPGNLRELRNVIRRAALFVHDDILDVNALPPLRNVEKEDEKTTEHISLLVSEDEEKERIMLALEKTSGNKSKAARLLNIDRKTLYNKLRRYKL